MMNVRFNIRARGSIYDNSLLIILSLAYMLTRMYRVLFVDLLFYFATSTRERERKSNTLFSNIL